MQFFRFHALRTEKLFKFFCEKSKQFLNQPPGASPFTGMKMQLADAGAYAFTTRFSSTYHRYASTFSRPIAL